MTAPLIKREDLKRIWYLDHANVGDARTVNLMPLWDGTRWHQWLPTERGLIEVRIVDVHLGDYVAKSAITASDLHIPFVEFMWQRASYHRVCHFITAIIDDFHNMATSITKIDHFFEHRVQLVDAADAFARTEIEYLFVLARSIFDLLQELISRVWSDHVRLHDPDAEERRKQRGLPSTFSKVLLYKGALRTTEHFVRDFDLPPPMAQIYSELAPFFMGIRSLRDAVVHSGGNVGSIYTTDRGFCVDPSTRPFSGFAVWSDEHHYNERLVSLRPLIAHVVRGTIDACNRLTSEFGRMIQFPPPLVPGYSVWLRHPHNPALVRTLAEGGSPWWSDSSTQPTNDGATVHAKTSNEPTE